MECVLWGLSLPCWTPPMTTPGVILLLKSHLAQTAQGQLQHGRKVIRHARVDSRMIILNDQARQQKHLTLPIVTSVQCFAHHGLRQGYRNEKEKVATYILVQWAMTDQDNMHVQHNIRPLRWAVKQFSHYLHGHRCIVFIDHEALRSLLNTTHSSGKLARWGLVLQELELQIQNCPGKHNTNVDLLSRYPFSGVPE